jgi:hypothetical protein
VVLPEATAEPIALHLEAAVVLEALAEVTALLLEAVVVLEAVAEVTVLLLEAAVVDHHSAAHQEAAAVLQVALQEAAALQQGQGKKSAY